MGNDFLPQGYEPPVSGSRYMKFEEGSNKFRVMSSAIVGWEDWDNKTPVRTKEKPEYSIDPARPVKHFWAFVVWNYQIEEIQILEITQAGIQKAIRGFVENADWGDPKEYDIIVSRIGKGLETEYSVMPAPHKPVPEKAKEMYGEQKIDLNKLYENGDPFIKD